jgi:hypothetical protein
MNDAVTEEKHSRGNVIYSKANEKLENKRTALFRWILFTHPFNLKELLVVFYPLIKKNEIDFCHVTWNIGH